VCFVQPRRERLPGLVGNSMVQSVGSSPGFVVPCYLSPVIGHEKLNVYSVVNQCSTSRRR
jgi:hypothetical protein